MAWAPPRRCCGKTCSTLSIVQNSQTSSMFSIHSTIGMSVAVPLKSGISQISNDLPVITMEWTALKELIFSCWTKVNYEAEVGTGTIEGNGYRDLFSLPTFLFTVHIIVYSYHFSLLVCSVRLAVCRNQKRRHCLWHCSFYATKFAYGTNLVSPGTRQVSYKFLLQKRLSLFYRWHSTWKTRRTEVSHFFLYQSLALFLRKYGGPSFPWLNSRLLSQHYNPWTRRKL